MNHQPDDSQIYTYDDLPMTFHDGWIGLECPVCGPLITPRRAPTLSDFTNAAIEHLELHGAAAA
jgi:hypothetical protein